MSTLEVNTISPQSGTTITLGGSGDTVSLGSGATQSGFGGIFESQLLHVRDEKSSGTDGGSSVAGTQTRDLNAVVTNEITGASLSSNVITLPSGTYYIQASAPAVQVNRHQAYLYNNTDSSVEVRGTSEYTASIYPANRTFINGRFTISAEKDFIIQHYTLNAMSTIGLGHDVSNGTEVYTEVQIWKVA